MPIIELQRRLREIGRIRMGEQVPAGNGKRRPAKLANFRLTSRDQRVIAAAAGMWGGRCEPWPEAPDGPQWQVKIEADEITVVVPPGEMAFSQWYEQWSAGGCQARCDGRWDTVREQPCVCDPENRECKITTRLSVMLPDLPGMGLWRAESHGYYAAVELAGLVEVAAAWTQAGRMIPARLRLEQRTVKRPGKDGKPQTHRFAVPVLDLDVHPLTLAAGPEAAGQLGAGAIGALAAGPQAALPSGNLTPVPSAPPGGIAPPSITDQVTVVNEDSAPSGRRGAKPLPSTGLAPRTTSEIAGADPQQDASDGQPAAEVPAPSVEEIARHAATVFKADYDAAPRGQKTRAVDRLRHAAAYVATAKRCVTVSDCTPAERLRVRRLLMDITEGKVTYTADPVDDAAGVTFVLRRPGHADGDKDVTVLWADLVPSADGEATS